MTDPLQNKLFSKEDCEAWRKFSRLPMVGGLAQQILDLMNENERLREALQEITETDCQSGIPAQSIAYSVLEDHPNKKSDI